MHSVTFLASKACLLLFTLGFVHDVLGAGCPPNQTDLKDFSHSACFNPDNNNDTPSFPGVPNMDADFGCADGKVRVKLCCKKITARCTPDNQKPSAKRDCTTTVSPTPVKGGDRTKRNLPKVCPGGPKPPK
ncbi:hypothetical protein KEM48_014120 [Puccinia striiformis f. sp. tritici PST-130]|uniref:Secreted protein n=2 Tax=Puccinia striiformis TaxID=27350 RepID=A0A0L0UR40_9BASI|nr:hypothetical protein Pst134EB_013990 [Puccinia striiformis f. sp. tritici]KAI9630394.1 hypothetical protein KEM48_014120 [Puccinia striiformis f. sp. tritici PST-130]KNE89391.1 hypothetical protein PSTG_17150 [Puccinia striiformis f. sp. tritici PST-78]POW13782.1 hypothetical protein PSTT_03408 [Puccinia striiformis]